MNSFQKIYEIVKQIPIGKVTTYGEIAHIAGNHRWARVVGYALHANPEPFIIPCHRVVNHSGEICKSFAFGGEDAQKNLLKQEGVTLTDDGKVDLSKYLWRPDNDEVK